MRKLPLLFTSLLAACHTFVEAKPPPAPAQPFPQAITMMCDVDRLGAITPEGEALGPGGKRTAWIADHVDNPEAIELRTQMSVKGAAEQGKMLRARAEEAGVKGCALADALEQSGAGGLAP